MAFTVNKSTLVTALGLSTLVLLAGCSNDQHYKRQNSDDDSYLKAQRSRLHVPAGIFCVQNGDYEIPAVRAVSDRQEWIPPPTHRWRC